MSLLFQEKIVTFVFGTLIFASCLIQTGYSLGYNDHEIMTFLPSAMSSAILADPTADPLPTLSEMQRKQLMQKAKIPSIDEILAEASTFDFVVPVEIRLVGFDKSTKNPLIDLDINLFDAFLVHLDSRFPVAVRRTEDDQENSQQLPIYRRVIYRIQKASAELTNRLVDAREPHLTSVFMNTVPYSAIDTIISEDFADSGTMNTIYFLNLDRPGRNFLYGDSSDPAKAQCLSGIHMGSGDGARFMWVDLSATQVSYGPTLMGEGGVSHRDFPQIPLTIRQDRDEDQVALELTSFAHETVRLLLSPPMEFLQKPLPPRVVIKLIVIHDHAVDEEEVFSRFNESKLLEPFQNFRGVEFSVVRSDVSMLDNNLFASVISNSMTTFSSASQVGSSISARVEHFLDSTKLEHWLKVLVDDGATTSAGRGDTKVVPVYLFDFSHDEVLLIDRHQQAAAFPNFVVGVQTTFEKFTTRYHCNGVTTRIYPRDALQALVGGILQTAFGVSPTELVWDSARQRFRTNWLWSTGGTPFGPFSTDNSLSFSIHDTAHTNALVSSLHYLLTDIHRVLSPLSKGTFDFRTLLDAKSVEEFYLRWKIIELKLSGVAYFMSLHNYNSAGAYILNSKTDLGVIDNIVSMAMKNSRASLRCAEGDGQADESHGLGILYMLLGPVLTISLALIAFVRAKIFQK